MGFFLSLEFVFGIPFWLDDQGCQVVSTFSRCGSVASKRQREAEAFTGNHCLSCG